jgi:hypothetical protein
MGAQANSLVNGGIDPEFGAGELRMKKDHRKRERRAWRLVLLVLALVASFVPISTPAAAHGNCTPNGSQPDRPRVNGWIDLQPSTYFIKGQTKFICEGGESHSKIVVKVRLRRCHTGGPHQSCNQWEGWNTLTNTCNNASVCQKTITSPPCNDTGYIYVAWGRWAVYNADGGLAHTNPSYPAYDLQFPLPTEGAFYC